MSTWQLTKSTLFLVRPLGLVGKNEFFNEFCEIRSKLNFQNAYIADAFHVNVLDCPVYLLFRPRLKLAFENFVVKQYEKGLLKEDYSYENGYVVLLYDFPPEFKSDYKKILDGKYSKTSKAFQSIFPDLDMKGQHTIQHLVFTKHEDLRNHWYDKLGDSLELDDDAELYSIMYPEQETLNIENIKE